jgi:hypothetical protein
MKRTFDKIGTETPAPSQWICFVRDVVSISGCLFTDPAFTCLFFFDQTSTPDADKILTLLRKKFKENDEMVNVILHLAVKGRHPRYLLEYDPDNEPDLLNACGYADLIDCDDGGAALDELIAETKDIQNFGTWKAFPSDDAEDVDMECVRIIRYYTRC